METSEKVGIEELCGATNDANFDGIFKSGKFRSKDHEMRFEVRTGQPVANDSQKDFSEGDTVTNSQGRHVEARSRASACGSPCICYI